MLKGKNILLGVTGSIAAYKSATLIRLLVKEGAEVKVLMTPLAKEFISPLSLASLSKNPILVDFFNPENGEWNSHVDLGSWADMYIIAPATANTIGKMANGIADNLLLTTYLSAKCPVFIAPAMDLDMYKHQTTQSNLNKLISFGNRILESGEGELASGLIGKGRMQEPEDILSELCNFFQKKKSLLHKNILITAGPTQEKIDAVRFIGNHSSGKMGYALAQECANRGANVTIISGPINNKYTISENIKIINVCTAEEMYDACKNSYTKADVMIFAAAVADFTPEKVVESKIKREKENIKICLKPTKDIAAEIGRLKNKSQISIGFALEKENEQENAKRKLKYKNLDIIILNSLNDKGAGFNTDTNKITILNNKGQEFMFNLKHKDLVAMDIIDNFEEYLIEIKR